MPANPAVGSRALEARAIQLADFSQLKATHVPRNQEGIFPETWADFPYHFLRHLPDWECARPPFQS
jgi:hypothetical protein